MLKWFRTYIFINQQFSLKIAWVTSVHLMTGEVFGFQQNKVINQMHFSFFSNVLLSILYRSKWASCLLRIQLGTSNDRPLSHKIFTYKITVIHQSNGHNILLHWTELSKPQTRKKRSPFSQLITYFMCSFYFSIWYMDVEHWAFTSLLANRMVGNHIATCLIQIFTMLNCILWCALIRRSLQI